MITTRFLPPPARVGSRRTGGTALVLLVVLTLAGCAQISGPPSHQVHVDAVVQVPIKRGATYRISSAKGPNDEATLMYAEAAGLVKAALATKGVVEAPAVKYADMVIEIDYGMAPPRAKGREAAQESAAREPLGPIRAPGMGDGDVSRLRAPGRGPLEKHLMISAREANPKDGERAGTLWRVELSVTDLSNDIRKYLPLLATVAIDGMGTDTGGEQVVKIREDNKSAALLRRTK